MNVYARITGLSAIVFFALFLAEAVAAGLSFGFEHGKPVSQYSYCSNERIAPGVLEEVRRLNPVQKDGRRKWKHHQWFRPDPGYVKLNQHLAAIIALMRAAPNWTGYQRSLKRAFPKMRDQLEMGV